MPLNNWWAGDPSERYWMEITDRKDVGADLWAPQKDARGHETWSYSLVSYVQPGDRVFHWHKLMIGEPAIVGWSEATGPLEQVTRSWQAKGAGGRTRAEPTVGPAWRMPLQSFTRLADPVTESAINERRHEILAILDDIAQHEGGRSIYAPFQHYGGRELRAQQGYLTKFPRALVDALFELPPEEQSDSATERFLAARLGRSAGYQADAEVRSSVEQHAVQAAIDYYSAAGATQIDILGKPYDLRVVIDGVERHVEVKGTVGLEVDSVQLTQGEVEHALSWPDTDLFVVDNIRVSRNLDDGTVTSTGGFERIWPNWVPHAASLRPLGTHCLP